MDENKEKDELDELDELNDEQLEQVSGGNFYTDPPKFLPRPKNPQSNISAERDGLTYSS